MAHGCVSDCLIERSQVHDATAACARYPTASYLVTYALLFDRPGTGSDYDLMLTHLITVRFCQSVLGSSVGNGLQRMPLLPGSVPVLWPWVPRSLPNGLWTALIAARAFARQLLQLGLRAIAYEHVCAEVFAEAL